MKKVFIFYTSGSYGSWIEWLLGYGHETHWQFISSSQLLDDGSSHSRNPITDPIIRHPNGHAEIQQALLHIADSDFLTYRCIPKTSAEETIDDIVNLVASKEKTIYIAINTQDEKDIVVLNMDKKIKAYRTHLDVPTSVFQRWKRDATAISDLEDWEFRELFSLYYFPMIDSLCSPIGTISPDALTINIDEILYGDVDLLVKKMFSFCNIPLRDDVVPHMQKEHARMLELQQSIKELAIIKETINACLEGREIEIPPISLVAQAIIQKRLRDQGVELRCYGLNNWPKTSSELIKLLLL